MRLVPLLLLAACADPYADVVGPFTGEARRYVVDQIAFATTNAQAKEYGGDLNGDGIPDNQLGQVISTLASEGDVTTHGAEVLAGGAIASSVIITADDFTTDDTVSVLYLGTDDATGVVVGGALAQGTFEPNRSPVTKVPGSATLHLPVFVDADPSIIPIIGLEIELTSDGSGGFDAELHGAVPKAALEDAAYKGISEMLANNPAGHPVLRSLLDNNPPDGVVSRDEVLTNSLIVALLASDLTYAGTSAVSFGFRAHLTPCADGRCSELVASCFDRVQDGGETHVDCGGSCHGCLEGATCSIDADCESVDCTDGACGPPRCDNGVRDGLETDVDCGSACGQGCGRDQRCFHDADCASGFCGAPCNPDVQFCGDIDFSTCQ